MNSKTATYTINSAARIQHQAVFLSAYTYDIEYKSTKMHANADSLSHLPVQGEEDQGTKAYCLQRCSLHENISERHCTSQFFTTYVHSFYKVFLTSS